MSACALRITAFIALFLASVAMLCSMRFVMNEDPKILAEERETSCRIHHALQIR